MGMSLNDGMTTATIIEPNTWERRDNIKRWIAQWPAMARYCANVVPHPAASYGAEIPTVSFIGNIVTLSWCNFEATFTVGTCDPDGALIITEDIDWTDVTPDGRYIAHS